MDKLFPDQKILSQAAERGDIAKLKELIAEVANITDDKGLAPMHKVSDEESIRYLISIGADVNARDHKGQTPLHKGPNHLLL